jgi:NitT/TauT family transport system substrate-binding protein
MGELRRTMLAAAGAALTLTTLALTMATPSWAADKIKISLAATDDAIYLPFFLGVDKGFYKQLDLDVEIIFAGGGVATPALISGTIDFSTSGGAAVSAIIKGAPLKVIMNTSDTVPWKLWATQPEITKLEDLKGKSVGVQTRGDLFELSMRAVLRKAGLPGDAVVYTPLGFGGTQRLAVMQSGSLPGILVTYLEEQVAMQQGVLGKARVLLDVGKDIKIPYNGIATSDKILSTRPDLAERFARGTLMGVRYMVAQREGALDVLAKRAPNVPRELLRASIDDTAATMLQAGTTSQQTQQTEISLRAAMLGMPATQVIPVTQVFDYAPTLKATEQLAKQGWIPSP